MRVMEVLDYLYKDPQTMTVAEAKFVDEVFEEAARRKAKKDGIEAYRRISDTTTPTTGSNNEPRWERRQLFQEIAS